jgi:outer membrane protein TolC
MARAHAKTSVALVPVILAIAGCAVSPTPLQDHEVLSAARGRVDAVAVADTTKATAISLYEAIARSLKHNFDHHVEVSQLALRQAEIRTASVAGLPTLVANAAVSGRSNDLATATLDIPTGLEVPADSVAQDRVVQTHDLTLTWSILDFALSYVRAEQAADRTLIADLQRRKVAQRLIEDTRAAYWRALAHERLAGRFDRLEQRALRAIARVKAAARSGAETPMTALSYERELTQIKHTAEKLKHELSLAKSQLAALINLPPGVNFKLIETDEAPDPQLHHIGAAAMVTEAIFNRPEVREIAYLRRINEAEATAAVFELLPALRLSAARSFSDDHFLLHNDWAELGTAVAGNLIKLVQLPQRRAVIDAEREWLETRALATTAAIVTQVHISRIRHHHNSELLATARDYFDVQTRLVDHLRAEKAADLIGEQTLIREEMNLLVAETQVDIAKANVLNSSANLMTTLGYDLQGRDIDLSRSIADIAAEIRTNWSKRSAVSDRARYLHEIERARAEAKRKADAEERQRRDATQRHKAEQARLAKLEAAEAALERKRARDALTAEAAKARTEASRLRKQVAKPTSEPAPAVWEWVWPSQQEPGSQAARKPFKVYTGTK